MSQDLEIKHLSEQINTVGSEFNFIQKDKKTIKLYVSSTIEKGKYQTLIFKSVRKNGEWKKGIYNHLGNLIPIQTSLIPMRKIVFIICDR